MGKLWRRLVMGLALLGLLGLVTHCVWGVAPMLQTPTRLGNEYLSAAGVIRAREVSLSPLHAGRIAALDAAEGDDVQAGQAVAWLDTTLLEAQIAVAQQRLAVAEAALRQLEAGARPGAVISAERRAEGAKVAYEVAQGALRDAQALRAEQQDLEMRIAMAEAQVEAARQRWQSALALKDAAEVAKGLLESAEEQIRGWSLPVPPPQLPAELKSALWDWWKAWVGANTAKVRYEDAQAQLAHLRAVRDEPQELDAQVAMAEAGVAQAQAALEAAQAQWQVLRAGATAGQLRVARARVEGARAALAALEAQRAEMVVRAPLTGTVLSRAVHAGEVVAAGSELFALGDLSEVRLTVYVPESALGRVAVRQQVHVTVDAWPGRTFIGEVARVADESEYTPRNIATKEERVNTVYAVEVRLPNEERLLKPGMPAEALFAPLAVPATADVRVELGSSRVAAQGALELSGVLQGEEVRIAAEVQGYVAQVLVDGGEAVVQDQPLLVLTSSAVQGSVDGATAALQTAQAELERVRAGPRAEEVAIRRAHVAMAKAEEGRAYAAWQAAQRVLENPQQLDEQILAAKTQVALAAQGVQLAEAELAQARRAADAATWGSSERRALELKAQAAEAALAAARADERAAQVALEHLQAIRAKPLALQAQANAAQGQYRIAVAATRLAEAELADLLAGATREEVALAEANVAAAQAELELARALQARLTVRAPSSGRVVTRMVAAGETALPGATLLTVADLSTMYLTVYVPATQVGRVSLGQAVDVSVDSFPGRRFAGEVVHIADEPQYTPRNIATKEERVNTVYAVKIRLDNAAGLLKPGMAADAVFGVGR